jgi:3'-phosphoadenosine 5'-phosphosulfate sulfotransferase (PAPS reductase)/FAD synthetase
MRIERRKRKPQYIASLSYGKDSIAMLEVIKREGLPLDRIVHVELMATDEIPAELPAVVDFKKYADDKIFERYGIAVEHIRAKKSYEEYFYSQRGTRTNIQGIRGFPSLQGCWASSNLKLLPLRKIERGNISYIGICADEVERHNQLTEWKRAPLVEYGVTEKEARQICEDIGLLSPIYQQTYRTGCWFCHMQSIDQLRNLRANYPQYWEMMLKWDSDSPVPFQTRGLTVREYEKRFADEERTRGTTESILRQCR